jgi:anti-anti-sigma factor
METKTSKSGAIGTIQLIGRFDWAARQQFKEAFTPHLEDAVVRSIEINLAELTYLDSSALGMLLLLREKTEALNKTVVLRAPNGEVQNILDIANFKKIFTIR